MRFALGVVMLLAWTPAFAQQAVQPDPAQDLFTDIQGSAVSFKHVNESALALLKAYGALKTENDKLKAENEKLKSGPALTAPKVDHP